MLRRNISATRLRRALSTATHDVVIAGDGVVGASAAYHLALEDPSLRVCVVERDPTFAHASAMLSAGGIRQQFSLAANIQLSLYGIDFLRRAPVDLRLPGQEPPDVQFREQGYLFLASEQGEPTLRRNHATQVSQGVTWTTLLGPDELATRFPWLNVDGVTLGCVGEQSEGCAAAARSLPAPASGRPAARRRRAPLVAGGSTRGRSWRGCARRRSTWVSPL
jgi:FAD-dependent oxidoreductase domain-containing protein 1